MCFFDFIARIRGLICMETTFATCVWEGGYKCEFSRQRVSTMLYTCVRVCVCGYLHTYRSTKTNVSGSTCWN